MIKAGLRKHEITANNEDMSPPLFFYAEEGAGHLEKTIRIHNPPAPAPPGGRRAFFFVALWTALLLTWAAIPQAHGQTAGTLPKTTIAGRLHGAPSNASIQTARIVLAQYTLDAEERIQKRKVEEVSPGGDGQFRFKPVSGQVRGMYRITATLGAYRTRTGLFPLAKPGENQSFDLRFPRLSEDRSALRIEEGTVVVETRKDSVVVTELVRLLNPTQHIMEGVKRPFELFIPEAAEALEMLSPSNQAATHRRVGSRLLVPGHLPPGRTLVAFRYTLPATSATLSLEKRYAHPMANFVFLSPEGGLKLASAGFTRSKERIIEKRKFQAWSKKDVAAGSIISLKLTGFPQLTADRSALRIQEARIAFEPASGGAYVTEVVHYINPTKDTMEGVKNPLEFSIPAGAEPVEMIQTGQQKKTHRQQGSKLLVYSNLPPGRTTVAFRYRLAAGWGSISLEKRFRQPVANFIVLWPEGTLSLEGEGFARDEIRIFNETRFETWVRKGIDAGRSVKLTVSGLPIPQRVVLPWIAVFLAIMAGVVAWYSRKRIPGEEARGQ